MTHGRKRRIFGAVGISLGGLLTAVVTLVQWVAYSNAENFTNALRVALQSVGVVGVVAIVIFVAGLVILATAHGPRGLFYGSRLPTIALAVLAFVYAGSQVFFRVFPYFFRGDTVSYAGINRGVNIVVIAAIMFAALAMLLRSTIPPVPRAALFLPALLLIALQFPFPLPYPGYLLPQVVFHLSWVAVGILYLVARPLATRVPEASENLTE